MFECTAFAHSQQTNLSVLHVERLVRELPIMDRGVYVVCDSACLEEHTWHNTVHLTALVGHHFAFCSFSEALTESKEIRTRLGCNVAEQFKNYNTAFAGMC